jgi:RNA ligase (TIGR02306 family)
VKIANSVQQILSNLSEVWISREAYQDILNWRNVVDEVKSTHRVEVVPLVLEKHPNADKLSVVRVYGYTCCTQTDQWYTPDGTVDQLAAWVPPDSLVPVDRPEFSFLASEAKYNEDSSTGGTPLYARIKAKKLRGVVSYGLLVPAPEGAKLGDDVASQLGVVHYEPVINDGGQAGNKLFAGGEVESGPSLVSPKYDVESFQRYAHSVFVEGEPVWITQKIHGANGRWVYSSANSRMYCGSRTEWKKEYTQIPEPEFDQLVETLKKRILQRADLEVNPEEEARTRALAILDNIRQKNANPQKNLWWSALDYHPELRSWCEAHPDVIVYGEVYGQVQKGFTYGVPHGENRIAVFDLLVNGAWLDPEAARLAAPELPWVPVLERAMPYDFDKIVALAETPNMLGGDNISEGIVVRPIYERWDKEVGRVQLKVVSVAYLGR